MSQSKPRFYLDENMDPEIAIQLANRGIDALSAKEARMLTLSDRLQLRFAIASGRVLCSKDSDFTRPAVINVEHHGIAFFPDSSISVGYAVNALTKLYQNETAESMKNSLRYM